MTRDLATSLSQFLRATVMQRRCSGGICVIGDCENFFVVQKKNGKFLIDSKFSRSQEQVTVLYT